VLIEEKRGKDFWPRKTRKGTKKRKKVDTSGRRDGGQKRTEWTREEKVLSAGWKESAE